MLFEEFNASQKLFGQDVFKSKVTPEILINLNHKFTAREYQKEALGRFIFYFKEYQQKKIPIHLLFHMATGCGKTYLMAAKIIYLYQMGYRNFIFFVNSTNIIEKTKDNFLNPLSIKYLFANKIKFDAKEAQIKDVDNFDGVSTNNINILFTTIQGLHSDLNNPKENSLTYEDFDNKNIVLISDEAHHINTLTKLKKTNQQQLVDEVLAGYDVKGLNKSEEEELRSWEGTVQRILHRNTKNILLEYTATINLYNDNIKSKYQDKIIYQYDLKAFRNDGYSKEIEVLQADLSPIDRALQAVVLSQYRRIIAGKYKINLKPVILFKANYVNIPKSRTRDVVVSDEFKAEFIKTIKNLKISDIQKIKDHAQKEIKKAFEYFQKEGISLDVLVQELKNDFDETKCLSVNDESQKEKYQILVNSLEDKNNEIRAVFAVEKLNEGWDVLNLYDIVRLYNTRDARANRPGPTTMAEAQLIGRGARYYPFKVKTDQETDKRKYDNDSTNELRILEQLHYHSAQNPKYIQELNSALVQIGIKPERTIEKNLTIKMEFKNTDFWKNGLIFLNKKIVDTRENVMSLMDIKITNLFNYNLFTGQTTESEILSDQDQAVTPTKTPDTKRHSLKNFELAILRTAINKLEFYRFDEIKNYFPNIKSITSFITDDKYLGQVKVDVSGNLEQIENLSIAHKLEIAIFILNKLNKQIVLNSIDYIGSKIFKPNLIRDIFTDKILKIDGDSEQAQGMSTALNLASKSWYAQNDHYGTSEENDFIMFFEHITSQLQKIYKEIALLRNERFFAIYNFEDGQSFEPDFVLFLKNKATKVQVYQVFIEPKGDQFKDSNGKFDNSKEGWKQSFLKLIEKEGNIGIKLENKDFKLVGLPFYNEGLKNVFEEAFKKKLLH
jgi:type III restriction enzyme